MGNYRFKLSNMMPNAWFYKLRDMNNNKSRNHNSSSTTKKTPIQNPRKSYYHTTEFITAAHDSSPKNPKFFDTHFPYHDPPRKSSKKKTKRKTVYKPSPRPGNPVWLKPDQTFHFQDYLESSPDDIPTSPEHDFLESPFEYSDCFDINQKTLDEGIASWSSSCSCKLSSSPTDIIIDMEKVSYNSIETSNSAEFDMISEPELPPILTKPTSPATKSHKENMKNTRNATSPVTRKSVSRSGRVKIRGNWSKLASKKTENQGRKSVKTSEKKGLFYSESFAIVKASFDPEQDFRDSMMEMIVENNIRASKDLEDLLACYLSLNSNQYHDLIIKAFEQIWFDMPQH